MGGGSGTWAVGVGGWEVGGGGRWDVTKKANRAKPNILCSYLEKYNIR